MSKNINKDTNRYIAVFLDRDGVITYDPPHYAYRPDQMNIIPRSANAIKLLNDNKFKVIVVTNQSGIARGYYEEEDMILFNQLMKDELKTHNAHIDAIFYCPHHSNAIIKKYKIDCNCRKPKPGMLKLAEKELDIDLKQSFIIGDKKTDIDAGKNAGCKESILVLTGHGTKELKNKNVKPNFVTKNLFNAVQYILSKETRT